MVANQKDPMPAMRLSPATDLLEIPHQGYIDAMPGAATLPWMQGMDANSGRHGRRLRLATKALHAMLDKPQLPKGYLDMAIEIHDHMEPARIIICEDCETTTTQYEFSVCLECGDELCPACWAKHPHEYKES